MNVTTSGFSTTQIILVWTLLGLLFSWLIIFSVLALHDFVKKNAEWEDVPAPSRPILATSTQSEEEERRYAGVAIGNSHHEGSNIS